MISKLCKKGGKEDKEEYEEKTGTKLYLSFFLNKVFNVLHVHINTDLKND